MIGGVPGRTRAVPFGELVSDALSNLYALRQRSVLALIGIVIGTASVVAMLTIGHMAEQEALKLFSRMGVDKLVVLAEETSAKAGGLDRVAVETIPHRLAAIAQAGPLMTGHAQIEVADGYQTAAAVAAAAPIVQELAGLQLDRGRFIREIDGGNLVAIVGAEAATTLAKGGSPVELGQSIRVGRYLFTVIGLLRDGPATAFDPTDFNNAIIIPLATGHRALGQATVNAAVARIYPGQDAVAAAVALEGDMRRASPNAQIRVQSAKQLIQTLKAQKAVHTRLLAAIGGISLLVGGIGVMNVMLMSVMERRREIGLRAAIGAAPLDIQLMFLIEASALALAGGVLGAALGVAAAFIVANASGWSFSLALYALPLGAGMAAIVGMVAGIYPAVKASMLDPIEALRAE